MTAAAVETEWAKTFDLAILILLIPTLAIFIEILLWAFRYRDRN